jgi:hypothetical protein
VRDADWCWSGGLEEVGGRAALLAGAIESHAGAGLILRFDGGMAGDLCKDQRCSVERPFPVLDRRDHSRICGALLRDSRKVDSRARRFCLLHLQHAAMCAVPSAAGRQIRSGAAPEGQHRRDQRQAEEEQQGDADKTSHSLIVAVFVSRSLEEAWWSPSIIPRLPAS